MGHQCHIHGHHHDHDSTCKHESHDCCCCCHESCKHGHHHEHQDFVHQLLEMADEAWMEILKDKIKQQILSSSGKNLDKLAKIVSESNEQRWKNKISVNKSMNEFKGKVGDYFGQEK